MSEGAVAGTEVPGADVAALRKAIFSWSPLRRKQAAVMKAACELPKEGTVLLAMGDEAAAEQLQRLVAEADPSAAAGRRWQCAAYGASHLAALQAAGLPVAEEVLELPKVAMDEASVDAAVVADALEYVDDPSAFMKELHRVLKPKSRVVLHIRRRRSSLATALRRVAGLVDSSRQARHPGFTPTELFDAMKDGFDIEERLSYGKFFTELTTVLAELFAGFLPQSSEPMALQADALKRARLVFMLMSPLFWMARALDTLCFFLPAHHLVVRAKRRMLWASRITPKMRDGRSLAEVVLGGKIGTAVGK